MANIKWVIGFVASLLLSGSLMAQYYDSPGLGQKPVAQHPQDNKPLGIRAGSFMLHPGVHLAAQYTDNVFFNDQDSRTDTIFHIRPYITAQSTWSTHSLNVRLAADIARYRDYGFRDYEDYFFQISGKLDVRNHSYFTYAFDYMNLHEGLNSRDSEQGFEPTRYDLYGVSAGYDHTFNRLSLAATYSWRRLDFDNAFSFEDGVIDNQDRDCDSHSMTLRAGYQFKTNMQAFASYEGYNVDFREEFDRNGFSRNGEGYTASAGLGFMLTGKLNGSVAASYHERSYDDPRLPNTSGWGGNASLQWKATALTSVYGTIVSSIEDTTSQWSSGYFRTLYSLRVDHELFRSLQLNAFVAYSDSDYEMIEGAPENARASDQIFRAGIGVNWFINRNAFLAVSYDYEKLESNIPNDGYRVNSYWLILGLER
jgi:hypothetical protein